MAAETTLAFALPDRLAAKADPMLIAGDERHFAALADSLQQQITDLEIRLESLRRAPGGAGQAAMERDLEIHRSTAQLRLLRRFGLDLCLGAHGRCRRFRAGVHRPDRAHRQRRAPAARRLAHSRG